MKKVIAMVMSLVLILSLVPTTFAIENPTVEIDHVSCSTEAGTEVTVDVKLTKNPGITTLQFWINFDSKSLKLTGIDTTGSVMIANGATSECSTQFPITSGRYSVVFNGELLPTNIVATGKIITLKFEVVEGAVAGKKDITISNFDILNYDLDELTGEAVNGSVTLTAAHTHVWSTEWSHDANYHWHECTAPNCDITDNSQKNSYSKHEGGTAYCTTKASCEVCGKEYGDFESNRHRDTSVKTVDQKPADHVNETDGYTGNKVCSDCNATIEYGTKISWGSHTYGDEWKFDKNQHWKECTYTGCSKKDQVAAHKYDQKVVEDKYKVPGSGSCTEPASYYYSCVCGAKGTETFTNGTAMGHQWTDVVSDATLKSAADCENAAVYYKTCSVCDKHDDASQTFVYGNALGHKWNNDTTKEGALVSKANCTSPAVYYKSCSVCGKLSSTETFESGKALGHTGGTATCEKKAECTRCNQTYGDFADHTYGDLIPEVSATHKTTGMKAHYQCSVCKRFFNADKTETTKDALVIDKIPHDSNLTWKNDADNHWHECSCGEVLDKTAHDFKWVVDKAATEEETGLKHEECAVCGAKRSEGTVIDKLDHTHNMELIAAKAATCTAEGNNAYYHCTKCGLYFKDEAGTKPTNVADEIIAKLAHTAVHHDRVEPTHFKDGSAEYWTCSVCGKYFSDAACTTETTKEATALAKIEHTYSDKWSTSTEKHWHECSCGDKINEAAHTWGEWTVTKAATATEAGEKQRECTVCHFTETAEILPLNCHTITFDANGGKTDATTAMTGADGKLTSLPAASRVGYSFKGWFTEKTGGEKVTTDTVFDDDATIYAQWVKRGGNGGNTSGGTDTKDNTKTDGKKVESGKTFDAGIAMYVGLSVLSVTGGALVIGKKKRF